jgi:citronellyl-CoA dehydrogenase
MWITNGSEADFMILLCNTNDGPVHKSKSLIVVPLDLEGVDRSSKIDKIGMCGTSTAIVNFDKVRVPKSFIIGQEGKGFVYQMKGLQRERIFMMARSLKAMELCINETIKVRKGNVQKLLLLNTKN